jgi:Nucleotidyl transferase AbiEii toxin, Type IV TA system
VFKALLERIGRELRKGEIPYMIIGGQAVLLYGEPRLTKDIDVTLGIGVAELNRLKAILPRMSLEVLIKDEVQFVEKTMVLPTWERRSGIRVDLIFSFSPYEMGAIERARGIRLGRSEVKFASPEDVIIHKVIAGRPRDLEDARIILLKNQGLDSVYIRKWLDEFDRSLGETFRGQFEQIYKESMG